MAEATITAANVDWVSDVAPVRVTAGAAITRGQVVYLDSADSEHKLADADAATTDAAVGISLTDGQDGKEMLIAPNGATINVGFTTTAGEVYTVSSTDALTVNGNAGGICLHSDLGSGDYVTALFIGNGTAQVKLNIQVSGQALA